MTNRTDKRPTHAILGVKEIVDGRATFTEIGAAWTSANTGNLMLTFDYLPTARVRVMLKPIDWAERDAKRPPAAEAVSADTGGYNDDEPF